MSSRGDNETWCLVGGFERMGGSNIHQFKVRTCHDSEERDSEMGGPLERRDERLRRTECASEMYGGVINRNLGCGCII